MLRDNLYWQDTVFRLESLSVYQNIARDEVIRSFRDLCATIAFDAAVKDLTAKYYDFLAKLLIKADELRLSGNVLRKYFIHLFLNDENIFTLACERNEPVSDASIYRFALRDVTTLHYFCDFDLKNLCDNIGFSENLTEYKPASGQEDPYLAEVESARDTIDKMNALIWRYQRMGAGEMATCAMFKLDDETGLPIGVRNADPVTLTEIVGCDWQKATLVSNTEALLAGYPANNVLLAGSRGNGKSSCVKALANEYFDQGLRLIEVDKDQARLLPALLEKLALRGKYFIIFMDDLSFEQFETQYKYLKSCLEGSTGRRPANVVFYTTSNRRHIVRENWSDRNESEVAEEVHTTDSVNEKLSLSDRFGLTITFPSLSRADYYKLAVAIAAREHIVIDADFLTRQADLWVQTQKNVSGRTAQQFINHIKWELHKSL